MLLAGFVSSSDGRAQVAEVDVLSEARQLQDEATELYDGGRPEEALPLAERALEIRETVYGRGHPLTASTLNTMGLILQSLGDFEGARPYQERALAILERALGAEHSLTAVALHNLGALLRAMGDPSAAGSYFERALAIQEKVLGPDHPDVATSLINLGALRQAAGDFDGARSCYERALTIVERGLSPSHPNAAAALDGLGGLLEHVGDLPGAEPYYVRALAIREDKLGPDHPDTALSLTRMGSLLHSTGELQQAKSYYERALAVFERGLGADHPHTATGLNNLGALLQDAGDLPAAKGRFERALAIREKVLGPEHPDTAISLHNLAYLLQAMGDFEAAEAAYERSLAIRERVLGPDHSDTAIALNNLGFLLQTTGDLRRARSYYERALAIFERTFGPKHSHTATLLNNLGLLAHAEGDLEAALPYYERTLAITEEVFGSEDPRTATALNNLGGLLAALGNPEAARSRFEASLAIVRKKLAPGHPDTAMTLNNLAGLLRSMGDLAGAISLTEQALEAEEQALGAILSVGTEAQKLSFLQTLEGSGHAAISLHVQGAAGDAASEPDARRLAFTTVLRRKGRALDATVEGLRAIRRLSPENRILFDRLIELKATQSHLLLTRPDPVGAGAHPTRIATLDREIRAAESSLMAATAAYRVERAPVTLEQVRRRLAANTALVEFFVYRSFRPGARDAENRWGPSRYVAYVLQQSSEAKWLDLGPADVIDAAVRAFRDNVAQRGGNILRQARALDALTMKGVRALLDPETTNLLISPDGELNLVPFAALVDVQGRYLIERFELSYVASGRDLLQPTGVAAHPEEPLLLGGAAFDGSFGKPEERDEKRGAPARSADMGTLRLGPLSGTGPEVESIGRLLQVPATRVLTGVAATEAAVKAVSGPRILHIASHGFFLEGSPSGSAQSATAAARPSDRPGPKTSGPGRLEDPLLRSGLALSGFNRRDESQTSDDGVLTALEVSGLDLSGTQLVTLSACETAVGEVRTGEGVFGLRRALVLAGARTQVMTLWKVADDETKSLMVSWYGQLEAGVGPARAMRRVQLAALRGDTLPVTGSTLRALGPTPSSDEASDPRLAGGRHPYFWASFIVSGDAGVLPRSH